MKKNVILFGLIVVIAGSLFFVFKDIKGMMFAKKASSNSIQKENIKIEKAISNEKYFMPIFAFHNVADNLKKDPYGMVVGIASFENELKKIKENGYKTIFVSELGSYLERGEKVPNKEIALTFDDGKNNFYTNVFPLLKKYNMKVSLYIITGVRSKNYLTQEQIKELSQSGLVEIGSHTAYHQFLSKMSEADQLKELQNSKKYLDDLLGQNITVICYPYGVHNEKTKEIAKKAGYKYGLNFGKISGVYPSDLFEIDRTGVAPGLDIVKYYETKNRVR